MYLLLIHSRKNQKHLKTVERLLRQNILVESTKIELIMKFEVLTYVVWQIITKFVHTVFDI